MKIPCVHVQKMSNDCIHLLEHALTKSCPQTGDRQTNRQTDRVKLQLHCHTSVCSFCKVIQHSQPSALQQNYILINLNYPHTIFLLYINYTVHNFVICWTILTNIFICNSNHMIYMYMSSA